MKKILFPTDFSPTSINAFHHAAAWAKQTESELITLHVYELPIMDFTGLGTAYLELYDTVELNQFEAYRAHISDLQNELPCEDLNMRHILTDGELLPRILEVIEKENIDLVIMGTQGGGGWKEFFGGSTTVRLMMNAPCWVMGIPSGYSFRPIKNLGFATRLRPNDFIKLKELNHWAKYWGAKIHCVTMINQEIPFNEVVWADWQHLMRQDNVCFSLMHGDKVEESLREYRNENEIDFVAVLHYSPSNWIKWFRNKTIERIAFNAKLPVMALRIE